MNDQLASISIQARLEELKTTYDIHWHYFISACQSTDSEKNDRINKEIAILIPLGNQITFLSGLMLDVMDERKEAKECVLMGCEAVQEAVELIYRITSKVPKGYIPSNLFEDLLIFLQDYKTSKI